jgi:hypothetical protein
VVEVIFYIADLPEGFEHTPSQFASKTSEGCSLLLEILATFQHWYFFSKNIFNKNIFNKNIFNKNIFSKINGNVLDKKSYGIFLRLLVDLEPSEKSEKSMLFYKSELPGDSNPRLFNLSVKAALGQPFFTIICDVDHFLSKHLLYLSRNSKNLSKKLQIFDEFESKSPPYVCKF